MSGNSKELALPSQDEKGDEDMKKVNRRGRGSRSRQAERHREKKNKETANEITAGIDTFKMSLGYTTAELFGIRNLTQIVQPQLEFWIDTFAVGALCDYVVEVLHNACKIQASKSDPLSADDPCICDVETLRWVVSLQIEAKLYYARSGTSFVPDLNQSTAQRVSRTVALFPDAILPIAVYLDQIGRFISDGQIFVPNVSGSRAFLYDYVLKNECSAFFPLYMVQRISGFSTGRFDMNGNDMVACVVDSSKAMEHGMLAQDGLSLTPGFYENPAAYPWFGIIEFKAQTRPKLPPTFEQIAERYAEFKGRVNRKLSNAFIDLGLEKGLGTEAQIVYTRRLSPSDGQVEAWSPRRVRSDSMIMGAILELGQCGQPLSVRDIAAADALVDTSAGLSYLATNLTKKTK